MYSLKRHTMECLVDGFGLMIWLACLPVDVTQNRTAWIVIDVVMIVLFVLFVLADFRRAKRGEVQL